MAVDHNYEGLRGWVDEMAKPIPAKIAFVDRPKEYAEFIALFDNVVEHRPIESLGLIASCEVSPFSQIIHSILVVSLRIKSDADPVMGETMDYMYLPGYWIVMSDHVAYWVARPHKHDGLTYKGG